MVRFWRRSYRRYWKRSYRRRLYRRRWKNNGPSYQKIESVSLIGYPPNEQQDSTLHFIANNLPVNVVTFNGIIRASSRWANISEAYTSYRLLGMSIKINLARPAKPDNFTVAQGIGGVIALYPGSPRPPNASYEDLITNNRNIQFTGSETGIIQKYFPLRNALPRTYSLTADGNTDPTGCIAISSLLQANNTVGLKGSVTITSYIRCTLTKL